MPPDDEALIGGIERREIRIVDYDPRWPVRFVTEAAKIGSALGGAALSVEHVGSTSVANLAAKPIIDVLLVVIDSADEAAYAPALEGVGYELRVREPGFEEHRMLRTALRDVHVHVFSRGAAEITRMIAFRDRLRCDPNARREYERVKRQLAGRPWPDMNAYASAKGPLIERLLASAEQS